MDLICAIRVICGYLNLRDTRFHVARSCSFSYSQGMSTVGMTSRETEVLEAALSILKRELDPKRIILFGSRAEGRHTPGSDFDIAVDVPKPADKAYRIHESINDAAGLYTIDIVYLPNAAPDFQKLILNTGKVLYERKA